MLANYKAFLFDLDGTLIKSTEHFEAVWIRWAKMRAINPEPILQTHHGRRMEDTIREFGGDRFTSPDALAAEIAIIIDMAGTQLENLEVIAGAKEFLNQLPKDSWAIVTSNHLVLVKKWLSYLNMPIPDIIVTAEDVCFGKPAPEGFLRASALLGRAPKECLVFEDSPIGIKAAQAAGCGLMIVEGTLSAPTPDTAGWIKDYHGLKLTNPKLNFHKR
jgi:mannitol-1-/sugar-/sorbitol-6-phosphatase